MWKLTFLSHVGNMFFQPILWMQNQTPRLPRCVLSVVPVMPGALENRTAKQLALNISREIRDEIREMMSTFSKNMWKHKKRRACEKKKQKKQAVRLKLKKPPSQWQLQRLLEHGPGSTSNQSGTIVLCFPHVSTNQTGYCDMWDLMKAAKMAALREREEALEMKAGPWSLTKFGGTVVAGMFLCSIEILTTDK